MTVLINEVVTEVVLGSDPAIAARGARPDDAPGGPGVGGPDSAFTDLVVRRAAERVMETLRREWER